MSAIVIYENDGTVSYAIGSTPPAAPLPVDFPYYFGDEITVTRVSSFSEDTIPEEVLLDQGVDYTLTGVPADDGFWSGAVTMITLVTNCTIRIDRHLRTDKSHNFPETGAISIPAMNTLFSRIFSALQDVRREVAELEVEIDHVTRHPETVLDQLADLRHIDPALTNGTAITAYRQVPGDGGGGTWHWLPENRSAEVALDVYAAVWLSPATDLTGASGAWQRQIQRFLTFRMGGAVAGGVVDSTNTVANVISVAAAHGYRIDGEGFTYAIGGAENGIPLPDRHWMENAAFKDILPLAERGANRTLFRKTGGSWVFWRGVSIDRNGDGYGGALSAGTVFFTGVTDCMFDKVEIFGNDRGRGMSFVGGCERIQVHAPHIHHMSWEFDDLIGPTTGDPTIDNRQEQIIGIYFNESNDWEIVNPRIRHLRGTVAGVNMKGPPPRYQNTDGISVGNCRHGRIRGGIIEDVGEGIDITGSGINQDVKVFDTVMVDCDGYGGKSVHGIDHCGYYNCTSIRAGVNGFAGIASPISEYRGMVFDGCESIDTGARGLWQNPPANPPPLLASTPRSPAGFGFDGNTYLMRDVKLSNCVVSTRLRSQPTTPSLADVLERLEIVDGRVIERINPLDVPPPLVPIGGGIKVFTTNIDAAEAGYLPGCIVRVIEANDSSKFMEGTITSFVGNTLTVSVTTTGGAGNLQHFIVTSVVYGMRNGGILSSELVTENLIVEGYRTAAVEIPSQSHFYFDYGDINLGYNVSVRNDLVVRGATAVGAGAATQSFVKASSTANLGIYYGTGAPGFSAAKGSLYTNTTATTTTTRLYVNTDGAGTWATLTTSA